MKGESLGVRGERREARDERRDASTHAIWSASRERASQELSSTGGGACHLLDGYDDRLRERVVGQNLRLRVRLERVDRDNCPRASDRTVEW